MRLNRAVSYALLALVLWPGLAWVAARALIVRGGEEESEVRADALVVLSGSSAYRERTQWAARLFHENRAPHIIITRDGHPGGWSHERGRTLLFYEREIDELTRAGVPPEKINVLPAAVNGTYDEALALSDEVRRRQLKSLLVVTSPYHTRRARWTLRRVLRDTPVEVKLESPPTGWQSPTPISWWLSSGGWRAVALEYPKILYYWVRY